MPLKYYCDFCDKKFFDSPAARKRHVNGASHQRIRRQWYATFESPEASEGRDVYAGADRRIRDQGKEGENRKGLCAELLKRGLCSRGSHCPFVSSHSAMIASGAIVSVESPPYANVHAGKASYMPPSVEVFLNNSQTMIPHHNTISSHSSYEHAPQWG
ncbi:unnamed protein product [Closterium sp. Yama58-4]|nr:unnamed protein product [Closterium sp. Yama58-4]